jgi:hypothetical protein
MPAAGGGDATMPFRLDPVAAGRVLLSLGESMYPKVIA